MSESITDINVKMLDRGVSKTLIYLGDGRMNDLEAALMILDTLTDSYVEGEITRQFLKVQTPILLLIRDQLYEIVELGIERRMGSAGGGFDPERDERIFAGHNRIHHKLYAEINAYIASLH